MQFTYKIDKFLKALLIKVLDVSSKGICPLNDVSPFIFPFFILFLIFSLASFNAVSKKYEAGLLGYVEFLNATAQSFSAGSALELSKSKFEIKKAEYLYERGGKIAENIEKRSANE